MDTIVFAVITTVGVALIVGRRRHAEFWAGVFPREPRGRVYSFYRFWLGPLFLVVVGIADVVQTAVQHARH